MRLFTYVVARDFGFAPNPFGGYCTLATCKPNIRRVAQVDDWIVGTGSAERKRAANIVFAMRVTEVLDFDSYWTDQRFSVKRPNLQGSKKQAFGDNIYHHDHHYCGDWIQENSHHSYADGTPNYRNISHDTKTNRILISDDFIYWGGSGPVIPEALRNHEGLDICARRGHKSRFPSQFVNEVVAWLRARDERGFFGAPLDWSSSA